MGSSKNNGGEDKVVEMVNITKIYPGGVVANNKVNFDLRRGEIHSLLGENGAGKSTLMKILAGCLRPTSGEIYVDGAPVSFKSPSDAMVKGIGMVHQHFTLIPGLTVVENIILGMKLPEEPFLKLEEHRNKVLELSRKVGLAIDPDARISELSAGEKQRVEILRLLYRNARILIFDEPTSILAVSEVESLFKTLRSLAEQGNSIVFVTHKMREALSISDRITVLRKGKVVKTVRPEEVDEKELIKLVIGEEVRMTRPSRVEARERRPVLIVEDLKALDDRGRLAVKGVTFTLYEREILGLAGIEGNGQKELIEAITKIRRPIQGRIILGSEDCTDKDASYLIRRGVSYIPEDRLGRGVAEDLSVMENTILKSYKNPPYSIKGVLNWDKILGFARSVITSFNVKHSGIKAPVKYLSGGNIQRLIVGREITTAQKIIIAEQPTAGLDVKSTRFVREKLIELRDQGFGILLVSTDLDEILELSDRILVIYEGRIVAELPGKQADPQVIGRYMLKGG